MPSPQVGLSSFHQQAIHFLCADLKQACQIWDNFSSVSPDLRLSLVTWVADGRGSQWTSLKVVIQRVLQVRHYLLPRLQYKGNNLSRNLPNSSQSNDLLRAQYMEIGEAKIGLNIMKSGWKSFFPLRHKKGCVFKLFYSVIEETRVQSS